MWSVGQKIGDYELLAHLRSGGMAMLFLARRQGAAGFSRDVAIKIVNPELERDSQFRTMFLDEARISSRIQHPNVVHVEELGEYEGSHFLVMEYVHGCSLSQLQRQLVGRGRRLSAPFATRIAMHVADALHAAHETRDDEGRLLNVVHRDVSPENVLLAYAGHVKLIDFGIAKAFGRKHKTQEGLLKGKFRYMAPEQAYGQEVDRRTDIYQLGIVLWEMLTLRRLFDAETDVDLIAQVREPRIPPPSALVANVPPALDAAVMAALDPNPARRPPDAQAFARMLGKAVPEALEVDGGSLSALVVATMHEQRQREKTNLPAQVYERLEREVQTQQMVGPGAPPEQVAYKKYTVEHTAPYGSDVAGERARPRVESERPRAESGRPSVPRAMPGAHRDRRLVRLASGFRTTLTRMTGGASDGRGLWLAIGGAIGLAGALALITLALRRPRVPPPPVAPPSVVSAQVVPPVPAGAPVPEALPVLPPLEDAADAGALTAPSAIVAPDVRARPAAVEHGRRSERMAAPIEVDGTPLIPTY